MTLIDLKNRRSSDFRSEQFSDASLIRSFFHTAQLYSWSVSTINNNPQRTPDLDPTLPTHPIVEPHGIDASWTDSALLSPRAQGVRARVGARPFAGPDPLFPTRTRPSASHLTGKSVTHTSGSDATSWGVRPGLFWVECGLRGGR